ASSRRPSPTGSTARRRRASKPSALSTSSDESRRALAPRGAHGYPIGLRGGRTCALRVPPSPSLPRQEELEMNHALRFRGVRALAFAALCYAASACVAQSRYDESLAEVRYLQRQLQDLQAFHGTLEAENEKLKG